MKYAKFTYLPKLSIKKPLSMQSLAESEEAACILNQHLWGFGEKRLNRLSDGVLKHLCAALLTEVPESREEQVRQLLVAKKRLPVPVKSTTPVIQTESEPLIETSSPSSDSTQHVEKAAFHDLIKFRVVTLNALKLRVEQKDLVQPWTRVLHALADEHVVILQEVPANEKLLKSRVTFALEKLNEKRSTDNSTWHYVVSEPSGSSGADRSKEVHVVFYRHPVRFIAKKTLHKLGAVDISHAPLVVQFEFQNMKFLITSVHLPPDSSTKRALRKLQLKSLLDNYEKDSSIRYFLPLTSKGSRDAGLKEVTHILAGDFNTNPKELISACGTRFQPLLRGALPTTVGNRAFDNVLLNADALNSWSTAVEILHLKQAANFRKALNGVSDHAVVKIVLTKSV